MKCDAQILLFQVSAVHFSHEKPFASDTINAKTGCYQAKFYEWSVFVAKIANHSLRDHAICVITAGLGTAHPPSVLPQFSETSDNRKARGLSERMSQCLSDNVSRG